MTWQQRLLVEIVVMVIFLGVAWFMFPRMMGTQVAREQEANGKRLFGEAWKEAKDL